MADRRTRTGLSKFDGRDVLSAGIAVTNAGDGLSKALAVEPTEFHHGETVYVVMECEVTKVSHDPVKDTDALRRVHTLKAGNATIIDGELVAEALEAQAEKIEQAAGVHKLPLGSDDEGSPDEPGD